tara:strand:- start:40 stop:294 length:255 start_codon:yes stop_codon:yes gene_type:complete
MNSVKIGHQEWSSENLNVDHFNNGDEIQQVESAEDWLKCLENKTPAWCYFDNKIIENIDSGVSWGTHRFVKIWKQNGEAFEFNG